MDNNIRQEFPLFAKKEIVYLDSAASTQTAQPVLDAIQSYYETCRSNVHRGVYTLSVEATERYESARRAVQQFIGAASSEEIVFTRGTTESINLVMQGWAVSRLGPKDKVVVSVAEHHSNFVPWQQLAQKCGCEFICCGLTPDERIDEEAICREIENGAKLVAVTLLANGLGVRPDVAKIIKAARAAGAVVVVDAAQAAAHGPINAVELDADFIAFSGHKLYGPTGIGVLYGRRERLEEVEPLFYGGDMIRSVSVEETKFNTLPYRLEAGTPNIAGVIGLGAAISFIERIGWERLAAHERKLIGALEESLYNVPELRVLGPRGEHHALVAFHHPQIHPHDLSQFFDNSGVAVRAGHHCAQPLLRAFGIGASTRASVGIYNTVNDVERFAEALNAAIDYFS